MSFRFFYEGGSDMNKRKSWVLAFAVWALLSPFNVHAAVKETDLVKKAQSFFTLPDKPEKAQELSFPETAAVTGADLVLSLVSLLLTALILSKFKDFRPKAYLWMLLAFNIAWFVILFLSSGAWEFCNFMLLRLRPELRGSTIDTFFWVMLAVTGLIYLWLMARSFQLTFTAAVITMVFSHMIYLGFALVIYMASFGNSPYLVLLQKQLGYKPAVESYRGVLDRIAAGEKVFSLMRLRAFHI